ncbi:outer membrane protein transport protein [Frederiksenia canicola]
MTQFTKTIIASLFTFSAAGASAAAFQLAEGSTSGLGMAFSGNAAVADDATVVSTNPALMTKFNRIEVSGGGIVVNADVDVDGSFQGHRASQKNIIPTALVPNLYVVAPVNDRFSLGGGLNVNYGLKSKFDTDYTAGVYGGETDLTALNLNFSGAYKLSYGFSLGAGVNAVYADAKISRHLGAAGHGISALLNQKANQLSQAGATQQAAALRGVAQQVKNMPAETVVSEIKGDAWGAGWNLGLVYEINENNRLGFAYHSPVKLKFKGEYKNDFPVAYNAYLAQLAATGVALPITEATGGSYVNGRLNLTLPGFWEISGYHKLTEKLAAHYSYKRTDWSKLERLDAYSEKGNRLFSKEEHFTDSSRIALGFTYDVSEVLTLRTGLAYDESASINHPSISIPDTDRTWYSIGATYRFTPNFSTDIGYAHLRGSNNEFKEGSGVFKVKSKANLYGLNVNYKF